MLSSMDRVLTLLLLFSCDILVLGNYDENAAVTVPTASNNSHTKSNVPEFLSNISLNLNLNATTRLPSVDKEFVTVNVNALPLPVPATVVEVSVAPQKVPLRRNATEQSNIAAIGVSSTFAQTSASVFFANYLNQQNVLEVVRNIDTRLRIIRNVEMRVATIQVSPNHYYCQSR